MTTTPLRILSLVSVALLRSLGEIISSMGKSKLKRKLRSRKHSQMSRLGGLVSVSGKARPAPLGLAAVFISELC